MLAKIVNDNAGHLVKRGVLAFFASKLAPTVKGGVIEEVDHPRFHLLIFAQPDHCTSPTLRLPTPYQSSLRVSTITVPSRPNSSSEPINSA
ncbi:hypothetical protein PFLuk1_01135 [Pseudomonas fluorescens]|nr:hypothetical protein PFLuk1_01135 [Pseudomonas fluorescens]